MIDGKRDTRLYGTIKVGDKGQVVIPAEARKEFEIKPGDLLFVMAGKNRRGIAMVKADVIRKFAEKIMQGLEVTEEERHET